MLPFRRILFPVDYSEACNRMASSVLRMADHYRADITLLHACPWPIILSGETMLTSLPLPDEMVASEGRRLASFAREMFPGIRVRQEVVIDSPELAIRREVERQGTDLIMMPTTGHGIVRRMLLGSTTAKVLHDLSCAIWTSTPEASGAERPWRSIVCALNLEEESRAVACAAASLAKSLNARLTLVHVVEYVAPIPCGEVGPYRTEFLEHAQAQLEDLRRDLSIDASVFVAEGKLTTCLRGAIERESADFVVVGRGHDQDSVARLWSRLYDVVRESSCPVLSI